MSDDTDWGDDIPVAPVIPLPNVTSGAVTQALRQQLGKISREAVEEILTPAKDELVSQARDNASRLLESLRTGEIPLDDDDETDPEPPKPKYASSDQLFREILRPMYTGWKIDGKNAWWAADWWNYSDAVIRLDAVHLAFEQLRLVRGAGLSSWIRDHADVHMRHLLGPQSPFRGAAIPPMTKYGDPLPYAPPPPGMFPPDFHH